MSISMSPKTKIMENLQTVHSKKRRVKVARLPTERGQPPTLRFGKRQSLASLPGTVPGGRDDQAGILSAQL